MFLFQGHVPTLRELQVWSIVKLRILEHHTNNVLLVFDEATNALKAASITCPSPCT
jgi:hypothetical protein